MPGTLQVFNIASYLLQDGEKRLDAAYYAEDTIAARQLLANLKKKGIEIKRIDSMSDKVFWPGRFKRQYVPKGKGTPFLMPKEALMFVPTATKFVRGFPSETLVKENWILVTRSGSIGRCLLVTKPLEKFILSDDLIRILPKKEETVGYLCAFLNSWIGQALLTKDEYGVTVSHIEPHHVAGIEVPLVYDILEEVNKKVITAYHLRGEAQQLLSKAEMLIHRKLGLPEVDEEDVNYFGEQGKIIEFYYSVRSSRSQT